ncbi:MAG: STAS domain-containing protein [Chloroflexota bacterium]
MSVHHERLGQSDTYVVKVVGRLDQALNAMLEETLTSLLDEGHINLIINLSETSYINSGGLRTLVSAWRRVSRENGSLQLCGLSPRLLEIFAMVGFDQVFEIVPDCREVLAP